MLLALFGVLIAFAAFGFDIRKKVGMTPFVNPLYIVLMKLSCVVLVLLYVWSLFGIDTVSAIEWIVLFLTAVGAALVIIAKLQLRDSFSWTGHFLDDTQLITSGVYGYVRNPLYTGVFIFELGAFTNFLVNGVAKSNAPFLFTALGLAALLYAVCFNVTMAVREAEKLQQQFGDAYTKYMHRTGMFWPRMSHIVGVLGRAA
jgi:protein-S-isoprenylcysteine O-methyltransferase Ste14